MRLLYTLRYIVMNGLIICCAYFAVYEHIGWCKNLIVFYAWFGIFVFLMTLIFMGNSEVKEKCIQESFEKESYKRYNHYIPDWLDRILDIIVICGFMANGWWFVGICFMLICFCSRVLRDTTLKRVKELESDASKLG